MPAKKSLATSRSPVSTRLLRPITARLNRIQDLVIEVWLLLDMQLKQFEIVQRQLVALTEATRRTAMAVRHGK